jgi:hypothetical protein
LCPKVKRCSKSVLRIPNLVHIGNTPAQRAWGFFFPSYEREVFLYWEVEDLRSAYLPDPLGDFHKRVLWVLQNRLGIRCDYGKGLPLRTLIELGSQQAMAVPSLPFQL